MMQTKKTNMPLICKERIEALDINELESNLKELQEENSFIQRYLKKFGIGYKVKSFDDEKGTTGLIRKVIQQFVNTDLSLDGTPGEMHQDLKDEIRTKISRKEMPEKELDWKVSRIARTEVSSIRELSKLIKWKNMGFDNVKHVAHHDKVTGEDSKAFDGSVFSIDFLLNNPAYRIPLRPNDRCTYSLTSEKPHISSTAISWVNKHGRKS